MADAAATAAAAAAAAAATGDSRSCEEEALVRLLPIESPPDDAYDPCGAPMDELGDGIECDRGMGCWVWGDERFAGC